MFRGDIEDELNHYHEDGYEIITSYTNGVNAYIKEVLRNPELLPIEFELLGIEPKLWTPEVVISRHQGLLGNINQELNIGRAVSRIGENKVKELLWLHPKEPSLELNDKIQKEDLDNDILELYDAFRKPINFKREYIKPEYRGDFQDNLPHLKNILNLMMNCQLEVIIGRFQEINLKVDSLFLQMILIEVLLHHH